MTNKIVSEQDLQKLMDRFKFHGMPDTAVKNWFNSLSAAPDVAGEAVGFVEVSEDGSTRAFLSGKFNNGDKLYITLQSSRTAELEEEVERLRAYEECLNGVIAWLKERGLYWQGDYPQEGADFAAILTEHEQQVSACVERQSEDKVKRLVDSFGKLLGEAKTLAKLAKHTQDCLVNESLPTGMGTWGCTCGLNDVALDKELLNDTVYYALLAEIGR